MTTRIRSNEDEAWHRCTVLCMFRIELVLLEREACFEWT